MKKLLATSAAFGLIVSPVMAQAADAARDSTPVGKSEQVAGSNMILIGAVIAAAIVAGFLIFDDNNKKDDLPTSP